MKRKLIKQGLQALTLTLPSSWIKRNGLKPGDEIEVVESDNALHVMTQGKHTQKEISVDVSGLLPRMADRFIARAYQKGYDKITLAFDKPELMLAIKNKVPELMGFEILNTSKDTLEIEVISSQLDLEFDTMLRRAFLLLLEMAQTCHDAWSKEDAAALKNIFYQDFEVNKFTYFCLRSMNTSSRMMTFGSSILYYLIESLEDLGDELKALGALLAAIKLNKDVLHILKKMNRMLRISYEFFYAPDKNKAVEAFRLSKEIPTLIEQHFGANDKNLIKTLLSIEFSTRIIYHLTTMRLDTLKELGGQR